MGTHKSVTVKQTGQQICWQKQAADLSLTVEPAHRRWTALLSFHLSPSDHHQQPLGSLFLHSGTRTFFSLLHLDVAASLPALITPTNFH